VKATFQDFKNRYLFFKHI